jgi:hypothetical protein
MPRPARQFWFSSWELEKRQLMTAGRALRHTETADVGLASRGLEQVHMQEDGPITMDVYRVNTKGPLQLRVTSAPISPDPGMVVGSLDQTVTFADTDAFIPITLPVFPGTPNPGEVDVALTLTPVDPSSHLRIPPPLIYRIYASEAALPPQVVSAVGTPEGIVVSFSKPMDPAGASNVKNYALKTTTMNSKGASLGNAVFGVAATLAGFPLLASGGLSGSPSTHVVRLKSARFDPATNTVTLVPQRRITNYFSFTLVQGQLTKPAVGRKHSAHPSPRLTDLAGTAINPWSSKPGQFSIPLTIPAVPPPAATP